MSARSDWRYGPTGPPTSGPSSQSSPSQCSTSIRASWDSWVLRAASVSSIRKTTVPPACRANAQLNRNVRASPTWGEPVGDGAMRTRTPGVESVASSVTGSHLAGQVADAGDGDFDLVADLHRADTFRGAGQDHVAGQQRHRARDVGDQRGDVEHHVLGAAVLDEVAVEPGADRAAVDEVLRVEVGLDPRAERAERVEALGPRELDVAALQVAGGHVIGDGEAGDHVGGILAGHATADPANPDCELALVVHL